MSKFVFTPIDMATLSTEAKTAILDALWLAVAGDGTTTAQESLLFDMQVMLIPWGLRVEDVKNMAAGAKAKLQAIILMKQTETYIKGIAGKLPTMDVKEKTMGAVARLILADKQASPGELNVLNSLQVALGISAARGQEIVADSKVQDVQPPKPSGKFMFSPTDLAPLSQDAKTAIMDSLWLAVAGDGTTTAQESTLFDMQVMLIPWGMKVDEVKNMVAGTKAKLQAIILMKQTETYIKGIAGKLPTMDLKEKTLGSVARLILADKQASPGELNVLNSLQVALGISAARGQEIVGESKVQEGGQSAPKPTGKFTFAPTDIAPLSQEAKTAILDAMWCAVAGDGSTSAQESSLFDMQVMLIPWGLKVEDVKAMVAGTKAKLSAIILMKQTETYLKGLAGKLPTMDIKEKTMGVVARLILADKQASPGELNTLNTLQAALGISSSRGQEIVAEVRPK